MANGYPMAAVICRREIAESFASTGIEYFNTFGGNSVACSIAEAVLDVIHTENLQENSYNVGNYILMKLQELALNYAVIGDVRGLGLFIGIEFIIPDNSFHAHLCNEIDIEKGNKSEILPHTKLTSFIVDELMSHKVLVSKDGPDNNVIKIKPPLVSKHLILK